jgi:mRNA interferase HicA
MKRRDLLLHLAATGCELLREGAEHSIWWNPATKMRTSIPRHRELNDFTAAKICLQLGIEILK